MKTDAMAFFNVLFKNRRWCQINLNLTEHIYELEQLYQMALNYIFALKMKRAHVYNTEKVGSERVGIIFSIKYDSAIPISIYVKNAFGLGLLMIMDHA